jgi:hypothetical protein
MTRIALLKDVAAWSLVLAAVENSLVGRDEAKTERDSDAGRFR